MRFLLVGLLYSGLSEASCKERGSSNLLQVPWQERQCLHVKTVIWKSSPTWWDLLLQRTIHVTTQVEVHQPCSVVHPSALRSNHKTHIRVERRVSKHNWRACLWQLWVKSWGSHSNLKSNHSALIFKAADQQHLTANRHLSNRLKFKSLGT